MAAVGLHIDYAGSYILETIYKSIKLNHMLYVPKIKKNVLSIAILTCNNNFIVEFNTHSIFVKDQATKKLLLEGTLKDGISLPRLSKAPASAFSTNFNFRSFYLDFSKNKL